MAVSEKVSIKSDSVLCSLSDGSTTIEWDIAGDSAVLMAHGAHTTTKFTSQKIKANGVTLDGTYESVSPVVTFLQSEAEQIETWWKTGTRLTYTVAGDAMSKTYEDCIVRISSQPSLTPGADQYVTMTIEITCLANVAGEEAE